jgi:RHS repeat-associated protein
MHSISFSRAALARLAAALFSTLLAMSVFAQTVTYFHNDSAGSPVLATDSSGSVVWREQYQPFGSRINNSTAEANNKIGFAGKPFDVSTGLEYSCARYYDPSIGRFMGFDPAAGDPGDIHGFNRYAYGNNNPYKFVDPDGRQAVLIEFGIPALLVGGLYYKLQTPERQRELAISFQRSFEGIFHSDPSVPADPNGNANTGAHNGNEPYSGPVGEPVVVVDNKGNAISVGQEQQVKTSPNGDYQQVLGTDGQPTGDRMDRGGHRGQTDPRAQAPHGHRPGVTTPDGNPHLPIN